MFSALLRKLDEYVPVKVLIKRGQGRAEVVVRLLTLATFIDDVIRVTFHFREHADQAVGYLDPLMRDDWPVLMLHIATLLLALGLIAQAAGTAMVVALYEVNLATKLLIGWVLVHPVLYAQLTNVEFCAESVSLVGGLLIMRAHLLSAEGRAADPPARSAEARVAGTQLLGRLLLPALYLNHAGSTLLSNMDLKHRASHAVFMYLIDLLLLLLLGVLISAVAAGLRSRFIALALAVANLVHAAVEHPWWRMVWLDRSLNWQYANMTDLKIPYVELPEGITYDDLEPWHLVDMHRYFFFQGVSTSGALLLLTLHGPGALAVEENEVLLGSVERAKD